MRPACGDDRGALGVGAVADRFKLTTNGGVRLHPTNVDDATAALLALQYQQDLPVYVRKVSPADGDDRFVITIHHDHITCHEHGIETSTFPACFDALRAMVELRPKVGT